MLLPLLISVLVALQPAQLCQKADSLYENDQYKEAVSFIQSCLPEVRKTEDKQSLASLLSTLSASYSRMGAYDLALAIQEECLDLDLAGGDPADISSSLNNLAAICLSLGDYDQAEKMILEAIRYRETLENNEPLAVCYGMASDILAHQGKADQALLYAEKALSLDRQAGRSYKTAIRLSQLAQRHIEAGRLDDAWDCLLQAAPVFQNESHPHSLAICRNQQGTVASRKGMDKIAANYFREALRISQETGDLLTQKNALKGLIESLKVTDPGSALAYSKEYSHITDSLFRKEAAQEISRLHFRYDQEEQEQALQQQKKQLRNYRIQITLLLIIAILLAIVLVGVIHGLKRRHRNEITKIRASLLKEQLLATHPSQKAVEIINQISEELTADQPVAHLSAREKEVAECCAQGLLAKEIAFKMGISTRTVETHKNNIFRKLGINSTDELVKLWGGGKLQ